MPLRKLVLLSLCMAPISGVAVGATPPAPARIAYTYSDYADLALSAPVAAHVRVTQATPVNQGAASAGAATRYYVEAQVVALIRGPADFPASVLYLADLPNAADPARKIRKKAEYLILATPVAGRPGELSLVNKDAHIPWSEQAAAPVRAILKDAAAADAAPPIVGVGRAFHVAGTLPGESETQLFLNTARGQPISLSILRRPGQEPQWAVALGDIVDEAAAAPAPNSLLWYRLACGLPRSLPAEALAEADAGAAAAIQSDYALVLERLGPCIRNRVRPS